MHTTSSFVILFLQFQSPEPWPSVIEQLTRLFIFQTDDTSRIQLQQTFRPFTNSKKVIHTQSAYGQIVWEPVKHTVDTQNINGANAFTYPYTGLYSERSEGIIKYSKAPNEIVGNFSSSFGLGVNLYRDYALPSGFVAMFPEPFLRIVAPHYAADWNIFSGGPSCTHVSLLGGITLGFGARSRPINPKKPFITKYLHAVGTSNLASHSLNGTRISNPRVPFSLCLVPNPVLVAKFKDVNPWEHPIDIAGQIPAGTLLYDVFAVDDPLHLLRFYVLDTSSIHIAKIYSKSEFVSSRWGDQRLFTQHQNFADDVNLRPDWKGHMKGLVAEGWGYLSPKPASLPSLFEIINTYSPAIKAGLELFKNPFSLYDFLLNDVGYGQIDNIVKAIKGGVYNSPNPLPNDPINSVARTLQASDDMVKKAFLLNANVEQVADALRSLHQKEVLSGAAATEASRSEQEQVISDEEKSKLIQFYREMTPDIIIDGHFLIPQNIATLRKFITQPFAQDVIRNGLNQIWDEYQIRLPYDFLVQLNEMLLHKGNQLPSETSFLKELYEPHWSEIISFRGDRVLSLIDWFLDRLEKTLEQAPQETMEQTS